MTKSPRLVSTRQAAEILGITTRSVTRRIATGELKPLWKNESLRGGFVFDEDYIRSLAPEPREEAS